MFTSIVNIIDCLTDLSNLTLGIKFSFVGNEERNTEERDKKQRREREKKKLKETEIQRETSSEFYVRKPKIYIIR